MNSINSLCRKAVFTFIWCVSFSITMFAMAEEQNQSPFTIIDENSLTEKPEIDEDLLAFRTDVPPGAYVISEKDYNVFCRGVEDKTPESLERLGATLDDINWLMDMNPKANMIVVPSGENLEDSIVVGMINVYLDNYPEANMSLREIINGGDPELLARIINDMGANSIEDTEIYENEESIFLYDEGIDSSNLHFCHYITLYGTTVVETSAMTLILDNKPERPIEILRKTAKDLADCLHSEEYLDQIIAQLETDNNKTKEDSLHQVLDLSSYVNCTLGDLMERVSVDDGDTYQGFFGTYTEEHSAEFFGSYDPNISWKDQIILQITMNKNAINKYRIGQLMIGESKNKADNWLFSQGYTLSPEKTEDSDENTICTYEKHNSPIIYTIVYEKEKDTVEQVVTRVVDRNS